MTEGRGIKGVVLPQPDDDQDVASGTLPARQINAALNGGRNFGGTRSAKPLTAAAAAIGNGIRDAQFAGLLMAIMQTMGLDELRIDQRFLRDDAVAGELLDIDRDICKQELIIRRR
jgi:hypothetical protein